MTAEMNGFRTADELQRDADEAKKQLTVSKHKLLKQREAVKQQVAQLSAAQKKRDSELVTADLFKKLEALEKTLRAHSQNNFQMSEFISQRKRESEYESIQKEVLGMATDINALIISQVNAKS